MVLNDPQCSPQYTLMFIFLHPFESIFNNIPSQANAFSLCQSMHEKRISSINIQLLTYMNIYPFNFSSSPSLPSSLCIPLFLLLYLHPLMHLSSVAFWIGYFWFKCIENSQWNLSEFTLYVYREDKMQWIQIFLLSNGLENVFFFLHSRNLQCYMARKIS